MRACIQRVHEARVVVDKEVVGEIAVGMLVLLGVGQDDTIEIAVQMANKLVAMRVFNDAEGKMNRSLEDIGGEMLVVSQFTLLADCRKGRRPSFIQAAAPEKAEQLYESFVDCVRGQGIEASTGRFRAHMDVSLINDGPVTLIVEL